MNYIRKKGMNLRLPQKNLPQAQVVLEWDSVNVQVFRVPGMV